MSSLCCAYLAAAACMSGCCLCGALAVGADGVPQCSLSSGNRSCPGQHYSQQGNSLTSLRIVLYSITAGTTPARSADPQGRCTASLLRAAGHPVELATTAKVCCRASILQLLLLARPSACHACRRLLQPVPLHERPMRNFFCLPMTSRSISGEPRSGGLQRGPKSSGRRCSLNKRAAPSASACKQVWLGQLNVPLFGKRIGTPLLAGCQTQPLFIQTCGSISCRRLIAGQHLTHLPMFAPVNIKSMQPRSSCKRLCSRPSQEG